MSATEPWRNPRPAPRLDELRYRVSPGSMVGALLRAWWPALLWAALIFALSTDSFSSAHTGSLIERIVRWVVPSITAERFEIVHHVIRKCAHFVEYFIFFLLLYRGVRSSRTTNGRWRWSTAGIAWLIAAGYSVLDEIHQIFVPSRGPSAWDSLLDSTGALIALMVLFILYQRLLRTRSA